MIQIFKEKQKLITSSHSFNKLYKSTNEYKNVKEFTSTPFEDIIGQNKNSFRANTRDIVKKSSYFNTVVFKSQQIGTSDTYKFEQTKAQQVLLHKEKEELKKLKQEKKVKKSSDIEDKKTKVDDNVRRSKSGKFGTGKSIGKIRKSVRKNSAIDLVGDILNMNEKEKYYHDKLERNMSETLIECSSKHIKSKKPRISIINNQGTLILDGYKKLEADEQPILENVKEKRLSSCDIM